MRLFALTHALAGLSLAACVARREPLPEGARDAIVVLGHRPARDEQGVEPETRARVEGGVALYRAGVAPRLVFTGGHTTPGASEAEVMAEYARGLGVPGAAIALEMESRDTIENARFTVRALARELGRAPRVVVVTSDYHVTRATRLFSCAGASAEGRGVALEGLGAWQRMVRRSRERAVRVAYWFFDECARARAS